MSELLEKREKKIDLNSLPKERADQLSKQVGEFVTVEVNQLLEKLQKTLDVYGLEFNMMYDLTPQGSVPPWLTLGWYEYMIEQISPQKQKKKPAKKKTAAAKKTTKKKIAAK